MREHLIPAAMTREMRRMGRKAGRIRASECVLHVGDPDGEQVTVDVQPWYDVGTRVDLVLRALEFMEATDQLVWLCRTGGLAAEDHDLAWLAAARTACAAHGRPLPHFHLVTRHGWHDLIQDTRAEWTRVRPHQE